MLRASLIAGIVTLAAVAHAADPAPLLNNGGAEQGKKGEPSLWSAASVPADGLKLARDEQEKHSGSYSLMIENRHTYDQQVSNNWAQDINTPPTGKSLRLSGWIKTADADAANICLQCWDTTGEKLLAIASTSVVKGDQDWTRLTTRPVAVPQATAVITVRAALTGKGKAWFDDIEVTEVGDAGAATPAQVQTPPPTPQAAPQTNPVPLAHVVQGKIVDQLPVSQDAMIISYIPLGEYPALDYFAVANNEQGVRGLIRWNKVPASANGKKFLLALYSSETTEAADPGSVEVHEVTSEWSDSVSWKEMPKFSQDVVSSTPFSKGIGWKVFDVTDVVKKQMSQEQPRGVMLKFADETKHAPGGWSGYQFISRERGGPLAPVLLVVE
ncbi:MAG TPA: DNRLRE domain-containing protein [Tepidisphaeraceae bacterium]|jgi:hypothetical protein